MNNETQAQPERLSLAVGLLDFDPHNPRFPAEVAAGPQADLIERFIRDERLLEVLNSIADQGYFAGEPLLVVRQLGADRFNVVEGNRRLAALKLLSGQVDVPLGRVSIEDACANARNRPTEVPCLIFANEDLILRYLGFRHITGIKSWGSLQKARYVKKLRDRFYANMPQADQRSALAREIGSRSDYVGGVLAALNLYERAERQNFYNVRGLEPREIDFSVLSTALSYSNIASFVGLEGRQDATGANVRDEDLKNLLTWMFVARGDQKPVLGDSRNLKQLAAVVASQNALRVLVDGGSLEIAFQLSNGPAVALSLALKGIHRKLQDAWSWLPQLDIPDPGDEDISESIRRLAQQVRDAIKAKRQAAVDE